MITNGGSNHFYQRTSPMTNITETSSSTKFYLYKITNLVNNKIYIGVHKHATNKKDYYMGSGTLLKKAIKKHGIDNFKKEILEYFDNERDMYLKEKEIVNENFTQSQHTYNITKGGGGNSWFLSGAFTEKYKDYVNISQVPEIKIIIKESMAKYYSENGGSFKNKFWITDGKIDRAINVDEKIPDGFRKGRAKLKQNGSKNPSFNKHWVTDGKIDLLIKKDVEIPKNFFKGRTNIFKKAEIK